MPTRKYKSKKKKPVSTDTLIKKIKDAFDSYIMDVSTILETNDVDDQVISDLIGEDEKFRDLLDDFKLPNDVEEVLKRVENLYDEGDIKDEYLLDLLFNSGDTSTENPIIKYIDQKGIYAIIRINNMQNQAKIEEFCNSLYPCENEKNNFIV